MNIVIPDHIPLSAFALAKLKELGATVYDDLPTDDGVIIERIRDAEIVTFDWMRLSHAALDAAPKLKFAISSSAGYNAIDADYAKHKGIAVLNCPTQNSAAVAEHAVGLMLAVAHKTVEANQDLRSGHWNGQHMLGTELGGKKLGLVGYGRIGKFIERNVQGFDMQVTSVNSASPAEELDSLLGESDIVCLCLTFNETTKHLIAQRRLQLMQPHAILINVARGPIVDQAALLEALKSGGIRGAGLDVFENEPTSGSVPADILELTRLHNVVATPHVAYNTLETIDRLGVELIQGIESCLAGKPINVVND